MGTAHLTGALAKLRRAKEHCDIADTEIRAFMAQHPNMGQVNLRYEEGWHVVYIDPLPPFPPHIALITGDGLNNLRAVLDHLVWQLVLREDQKPDYGNCFPIYETSKKFVDKVKTKAERGKSSPLRGLPIGGDAWAIIEAAQPFQHAEPQNHPLLRLAQLTNIDKHRTLLAQQHIPNWQDMERFLRWPDDAEIVSQKFSDLPLSLEHPTEIARFRFAPGMKVRMDVDGAFSLRTTLGDDVTRVGYSGVQAATNCILQVLEQVQALPRVQT